MKTATGHLNSPKTVDDAIHTDYTDTTEDNIEEQLYVSGRKQEILKMAGIIALGLAMAGYIVFRSNAGHKDTRKTQYIATHQIIRPSAQAPNRASVLKVESTRHKSLTAEPEKSKKIAKARPRTVEIRPIHRYNKGEHRVTETMPNVRVVMDGRLKGTSTKSHGVTVKIGPGTHKMKLEGKDIKNKTVKLLYSQIKNKILKIEVNIDWNE